MKIQVKRISNSQNKWYSSWLIFQWTTCYPTNSLRYSALATSTFSKWELLDNKTPERCQVFNASRQLMAQYQFHRHKRRVWSIGREKLWMSSWVAWILTEIYLLKGGWDLWSQQRKNGFRCKRLKWAFNSKAQEPSKKTVQSTQLCLRTN